MIRIGTRGSELALWQARHVAGRLAALGERTELVVVRTRGDRIQDRPLTPELGRGFFTKEIEQGLLRGDYDLAVHSLKDLAVEQPPGLVLAAVPARAAPGERLLIHPQAHDPKAGVIPLRAGARLGTSSPRRRLGLRALRPDLAFCDLRGNVPTRVAKLRAGDYDAIVLAAAGLDRLALDTGSLVAVDLPPEVLPGAPGQGALGLQARAGDHRLLELLRRLEDPETRACVEVERGLLEALGGGCSLPLGAWCRRTADGRLRLTAFAHHQDGEGPGLAFEGEAAEPGELVRRAAARLGPALTRPLAGRRFVLRGGPEKPALAGDLAAAGARVRHEACFRVEPLPLGKEARAFLARADCVLLAGRRAAARLYEETDGRLPESLALVVPGQASRRHAARLFPGCRVVSADPPRSTGLGKTARALGARRVLLAGAEGGRLDALDELAGAETLVAPLYRIRLEPSEAPVPPGWLPVFLSPSAVQARPPRGDEELVVAIGPTTAAPLRVLGLRNLATAATPDLEGLLGALERAAAGPPRRNP